MSENEILDLGAQDPEQRNSPVAWESDEESELLRQEVPGSAFCYFNGTAYDDETVIKCGTALLRCDRGIWVPAGPADPDNP